MKKVLAPPKGSKDRKHFSAVPPCLPPARPLMTMPTHRLPHNAGNASEILRPKPVPPALCGPFAAPLHAPLSAPGTLCGGDKQLYFRFVGLKYDMPIKHQVCAFVKNFFARRKDKIQPSRHGKLVFVKKRCHCEPVRRTSVAIPQLERKCIDNCPIERGTAVIYGGNRYLVPFNRGIATTSVRYSLAMTGYRGVSLQSPN